MEKIGSCLTVINKLQTTQDGGARLTLDISANESQIIQKLLAIKLKGESLLSVGFVEVDVE